MCIGYHVSSVTLVTIPQNDIIACKVLWKKQNVKIFTILNTVFVVILCCVVVCFAHTVCCVTYVVTVTIFQKVHMFLWLRAAN